MFGGGGGGVAATVPAAAVVCTVDGSGYGISFLCAGQAHKKSL